MNLLLAAAKEFSDVDLAAFVIGVFIVLVVGAVVWISEACRQSAHRRQVQSLCAAFCAEYERWRQRLDDTGELESGDAGLSLPKGEECFFAARTVLKEPRSVRVSGHSGYGVSVMRGVRVLEGETTSRSHDEWQRVSSGVVYITNKRVIFAGDMHNRTVKLGDVLAVDTFVDAVGVRSAKQQKTMRFCGINGQIAADTIELLQTAAE